MSDLGKERYLRAKDVYVASLFEEFESAGLGVEKFLKAYEVPKELQPEVRRQLKAIALLLAAGRTLRRLTAEPAI